MRISKTQAKWQYQARPLLPKTIKFFGIKPVHLAAWRALIEHSD